MTKMIKVTSTSTDEEIQEMVELAHGPERLAVYNEFTGKQVKKFSSTKAAIKQTVKAALAQRTKLQEGGKFPPTDLKVHRKRAKGTKQSWDNHDVAEARKTRDHVIVDGEEYRSVRAAFLALKLPLGEHIRFRMQLKAAKKAKAYDRAWRIKS